jgi:predicted DNA-binding WGR domain protein
VLTLFSHVFPFFFFCQFHLVEKVVRMLDVLANQPLTQEQRSQAIREIHDELDIVEVNFSQLPTVSTPAQPTLVSSNVQVDPIYASSHGQPGDVVYSDGNGRAYSATLNTCQMSANNNKFFIIQLISRPSAHKYFLFCRWGRVGESGQHKLTPFEMVFPAIAQFGQVYVCSLFDERGTRIGGL